MHMLMIAPEQIPVPGGGSVEICMYSIAKELAKQHKVTIVSRQYAGCKNISKMGELTIVRVPSGNSRKYISSVLRYIKGRRYDFIQVDNRPYYMAKVKQAFPRIPMSLFLHSLTFVPRNRGISSSLDKADVIIANSSSLKENLSRMFPKQKQKIHIVHLGVDVSRFKPASKAEKNLSKSKSRYRLKNAFTILFSGRIIPRKGVSVLIKATKIVQKEIPRTKLVITGSGKASYVKNLKLQAKRLKVAAVFTGRISHQRIHHMYRMADCFVCPSQRHEAFGLVNVEAMAAGVPVVASNIGGIKEVIKHGQNGFLVRDYKNPSQFAQFITQIGKHKKLAEELATQGRKIAVKQFNWNLTAANLASVYKHNIS
jgi:spore coat protein SA